VRIPQMCDLAILFVEHEMDRDPSRARVCKDPGFTPGVGFAMMILAR